MFRNLTYKQKLKLAGAGGLLALILCYRLSIRATLEEYRKYKQESVQPGAEEVAQGASLNELQSRQAQVDLLFRKYTLDTLRPEKNLLAVASNFCKTGGLQLKEYKPYPVIPGDSIPVLTRTVTVQGSFIHCLKFLYDLETARQIGRLQSASFRSYVDPQDKKTKLDCTLYIQNLIPSDHESH